MTIERSKFDKIELILGWVAIIAPLVLFIVIGIMAILGQINQPMIYIRALIVLPFSLWWGIRTVRRLRHA